MITFVPTGKHITSIPKENVLQGFRVMGLDSATFNTISVISWWSVLLAEETGVPVGNQ